MDLNNLSKEQMDQLIKMASQKTGADESELKKGMDAGSADGILKNLKPEQAAKVQQVLSDKEMTEKILSSPQAKMLLSKFFKGK